MKLCGGKSPGLIATNSSTVRLDYHTDKEGLSHGWSLEYSTYGEGQSDGDMVFWLVSGDSCRACRYVINMSLSEVRGSLQGKVGKGRLTLVSNEYFFRDFTCMTCDQGYELRLNG